MAFVSPRLARRCFLEFCVGDELTLSVDDFVHAWSALFGWKPNSRQVRELVGDLDRSTAPPRAPDRAIPALTRPLARSTDRYCR